MGDLLISSPEAVGETWDWIPKEGLSNLVDSVSAAVWGFFVSNIGKIIKGIYNKYLPFVFGVISIIILFIILTRVV